MRLYNDSCDQVNALYAQSAWWVAARQCIPPVWVWTTFLVLLTPSALLPLYRARQDMLETHRIMRNCSPFRAKVFPILLTFA